MFNNIFPTILYFKLDESGGNGGDDPRDGDEALARIFTNAIQRQIDPQTKLTTPNAYGIPQIAEDILKRLEESGHLLLMLDEVLRPIAAKILELQCPSDRTNPDILAWKFKDFDFSKALP